MKGKNGNLISSVLNSLRYSLHKIFTVGVEKVRDTIMEGTSKKGTRQKG